MQMDALFAQLEQLSDPSLHGEALQEEIKKSNRYSLLVNIQRLLEENKELFKQIKEAEPEILLHFPKTRKVFLDYQNILNTLLVNLGKERSNSSISEIK